MTRDYRIEFCGPKCPHYKTCTKPCLPLEKLLSKDCTDKIYEKKITGRDGKEVTMIFASRSSLEVPESDIKLNDNKGKLWGHLTDLAFSTENQKVWAEIEIKRTQTALFIDRYFKGYTYKDLVTKYDIKYETAKEMYMKAKNRVLDVLEKTDDTHRRPGHKEAWKKYSDAGGTLTKKAQYWILSKVLGMLPHEIADLYGVNHNSVSSGISKMSKKISEKELIDLFEIPPKSSLVPAQEGREGGQNEYKA